MRRRPQQIELTLRPRGRGGPRPGAGRKPGAKHRRRVPHRSRPALAARFPVHVTMRVRREIGRLRGKHSFRAIRAAFIATCRREHFRITDWSVQGNHLHLVAEAQSAGALSRGIQGFAISVAKRLNAVLGRRGAVFADRYHSRILRTPREVRNCLSYVMLNARRHGVHRCPVHPDVLSSWEWFDGWRKPLTELMQLVRAAGPPSAAEPRTWLRKEGWRRRGLICASEVPGGHRARAR